MKKILFIILIVALNVSYAQERHSFISVPAEHFTTDIQENLYIYNGISLQMFNKEGQLLYQYSNPAAGSITSVDASNPAKIVLYYKEAGKIILLNNKLAPIGNTLDLFEQNLNNVSLAAILGTSQLVLFDESDMDLHILDLNLHNLNSMRCNFDADFHPHILQVTQEKTILLIDSLKGVYLFDSFGSLDKKIDLFGIQDAQMIGPILYFLKDDRLYHYDTQRLELSEIKTELKINLKEFRLEQYIYLLDTDGNIYKL